MLPMPSLSRPMPVDSEFRVRSDMQLIVRSRQAFQKMRSSWVPRTLPPTFLVFPRRSMGYRDRQGRTRIPCMSLTERTITTDLSHKVFPHRDPHPTCFLGDPPLTHPLVSHRHRRSRRSRALSSHVVACLNDLNISNGIYVRTPWSVRSNVLCAGSVSLDLII